MSYHDSLSPKLPSRIWAMQKEIKNAYPQKVCHMLTRLVKKKKDAYLNKVCHMATRHVKKKRKKHRPYPRKIKEREIMQRSSSTIHQKYPHTCTS